jgi:hypothetical protein
MAKAIRHFIGNDTYGRRVEAAQRADGVWFARHTHDGPRGPSMCAWYSQAPTWEEEAVGRYTNEVVRFESLTVMTWGFQRMREVTSTKMRLRLPG